MNRGDTSLIVLGTETRGYQGRDGVIPVLGSDPKSHRSRTVVLAQMGVVGHVSQ